MFSFKINDKVLITVGIEGWGKEIGTVTSIDEEGYIHVSIDSEPGRAKVRINDSKVEFYNNYGLNEEWHCLDQILRPIASDKYYVHHHGKAISCSKRWSDKKCMKCNNKCCNICNLCKIDDNIYCSECIENDELFKKYRINKSLCSFCEIGIGSDEMNQCGQCNKDYCKKCGVLSTKLCQICSEFMEGEKYKDRIVKSIGDIIGIDLIDIISSYCIGYIIECNNKDCNNIVSICNDRDFENNIDSLKNKIYKYCISDKYSAQHEIKSMHYLHDKLWRLFCSNCTDTKLSKCNRYVCQWRYCSNPCYCNNYDSNEYCINHAFCGDKAEYWSLVRYNMDESPPKCCYRQDIYKDRNILYCDLCKTGFDALCEKLNVDDVDQFYRYGDYTPYKIKNCKGYTIMCNNINCKDTICINNNIDFVNNIDSSRNKIYKYCISDKYVTNYCQESMHFIDDKYWRIFCMNDYRKLTKCTKTIYVNKMRIECNNYDINDYCRNHSYFGKHSFDWVGARDTIHETLQISTTIKQN